MSGLQPAGPALLKWALGAGFLGEDGEAIVQEALDRLALGEPVEPRPMDWQIADLSWDTLEPGYQCPYCHDSRFVRRNVPIGHIDFGKAIKCQCWSQPRSWNVDQWHERVKAAQIPQRLMRWNLDNFRVRQGTEKATAAIQTILSAERGGETLPWLVLYGETGSGKSHLLVALAQALLVTRQVYWADTAEFLDACKHDNFRDADQLIAFASSCSALFMDEFGSQSGDDWGRIRLERILNRRLESGLPTFLGMTMSKPETESWSKRIADRLADHRVVREVVLLCSSYRREGAGE